VENDLPAEEEWEADALEPPPAGEENAGEFLLLEPSFNLAEESFPPGTPPPQADAASALPEPSAENLLSVLAVERLPPVEPAAPPAAAPAPPVETVPETPPAEIRPSPPPFIRPAEIAPPPPAARAPVPLPVNPVPDLPAREPALVEGELPAESEFPAAEEIRYSRVIRATVGQRVEIPFWGTGWVYVGELGARRGVDYESRQQNPEGVNFVFQIETPGTYGLKFYKQDFIRDYVLNDYVQVVVGEAPDAAGAGWFNPPVDRGRVVAEPRWPPVPSREEAESSPASAAVSSVPVRPDIVPEPPGVVPAASPAGSVNPAPPAAVSPETPAPVSTGKLPEETTPDEYIRRSREEYDAGRVAGAIAILDQFRTRYPAGSDEAWWLYGQLLEANSPSRDIRSALDCYRRLVREYPQSSRYDDARRRIAYLERYYFNIQ
jgi:hypothetical protein